MKRFDMENDYDGGEWIGGGEFCYQKKRKAKDDHATYGIWADDCSSNDSDGSGGGGCSSKRRKKGFLSSSSKDYTKPVSFVSASRIVAPNQEQLKEQDDNEKAADHVLLPTTAFWWKVIEEGVQRRRRAKQKQKANLVNKSNKVQSGSKKESSGGGVRYDVGAFEKHTKGIGGKILAQMGYEGGGLGVNEQGIVTPIQPELRTNPMGGIGFNDRKQAKNPVLKENWTNTEEELLASKEEKAEEKAKDDDKPMPELQYNIKLILDLAQFDIEKIDRDLRMEMEKVASLQLEKEMLQMDAGRQKKQLDSMEEIIAQVERIEEENAMAILTIESLSDVFTDLQTRYKDEYKLCNLSWIACSYALPLLIRVFQGWNPLQNAVHGLQLMASWKNLLQGDDPFDYSDDVSPYTQLVMEVVFPAVNTNTWNPRDPEPMLQFLELWESLLPSSVLRRILDNVIVPKLSYAVEETWDPQRETVPIHVWVHPWIPLLGQKLESLYDTIRFKLGEGLRVWHPSDASAYAILSPWKTVFDPDSWERLIVQFIVPRLVEALQSCQVNPADQKLDEFRWVMSWATAIPSRYMVTMLEVEFFSKWQQVLYHWLRSIPDFEEVTQWYLGWKGIFAAELLANDRIRYQFDIGLNMMNQAVEGVEVAQPGERENIRVTEQSRQFEAQQKSAAARMGSGVAEMSLKEIIEVYAQQHELLFQPMPGRSHNGLQIYGFGNVSMYVDSLNQRVFAKTEAGWSLVSLDQLLEMHHRKFAPKRR
ncbi:hypothetical protein MKW94_027557 [Papaver nudicaule]|uniref:G-patch domain-containing protein n=1 Tax=Papaver nudicaule TaxID=74823 RepID=A0AA42B2W8_PAPNU|nr:hypothetical protein [Papaver nudicaule]